MGHKLRLDNDEQLLEQCRGQRVKEEPDRQGLFKKLSFVKSNSGCFESYEPSRNCYMVVPAIITVRLLPLAIRRWRLTRSWSVI